MDILTGHIQNLITRNQLEKLKKTCDDLLKLNQMLKAAGLPLFQKNKLMVPTVLGELSAEMAASVGRLFYPEQADRFDYFCRLYQAKNYRAAELLMQDGLVLTDITHIKADLTEENRNLVATYCRLAELQRALPKADLTAIELEIKNILSYENTLFGDFINKITSHKIKNPFSPMQWQQVFSGKYREKINPQINQEQFAAYRHPDTLSAEFNKQQLEIIHTYLDQALEQLLTNAKSLSQDEVNKLAQYFLLKSTQHKIEPKLAAEIDKLLDERSSKIGMYLSHPHLLCEHQSAKAFFLDQLAKKWLQLKQTMQVTSVVVLAEFDSQATRPGSLFGKIADLHNSWVAKKLDASGVATLCVQVQEAADLSEEIKGLFWSTWLNEVVLDHLRENQEEKFIPLMLTIIQNPLVIQNKFNLEVQSYLNLEKYLLTKVSDQVTNTLIVADIKGFFDKNQAFSTLLQNKPAVASACYPWLRSEITLSDLLQIAAVKNRGVFLFVWDQLKQREIKFPDAVEEFCNKVAVQFPHLPNKIRQAYFMTFVHDLVADAGLDYLKVVMDHPLFIVDDIPFKGDEEFHGIPNLIKIQVNPISLSHHAVFFPAFAAALAGRDDVLKYLFELENTKSYFTDERILMLLAAAIQNKHLSAMNYLLSIRPSLVIPDYFMLYVFNSKHPTLIQNILDTNRVTINNPIYVEALERLENADCRIQVLQYHMASNKLPENVGCQFFFFAIEKTLTDVIDYLLKEQKNIVNGFLSQNKRYALYEAAEVSSLMFALDKLKLMKNPLLPEVIKKLLKVKEIDVTHVDRSTKTTIDYCLAQTEDLSLDRVTFISDLIALDKELKIRKLEGSLKQLDELIARASKVDKFIYSTKNNTEPKQLENAKKVREQLLSHWLKQKMLTDDEAISLAFTDPKLIQKSLSVIGSSNDPLVTKEMRNRASALDHLLSVIDLLQNNRLLAYKWRVMSFIQYSMVQNSEIISKFVKAITSGEQKNPFSAKQWQLFREYISEVATQNKQLVGKVDIEQLQDYQYDTGATSASSSSATSTSSRSATSTTLVPTGKLQNCADELIAEFRKPIYTDADRELIRSLFESTPSSANEFSLQQIRRVAARKLLEKNEVSFVLQLDDEQSELATQLFNEIMLEALQVKSEKVAAMSATPSPANLLAQSSSVLNVVAPEPELQKSSEDDDDAEVFLANS